MQISARSEPLDAAGLCLRDLTVRHRQADGSRVETLHIPAMTLPIGSQTGISGPSGSGKTTLLHVIAGLEHPATGSLLWQGQDLIRLPQGQRDDWRRRSVGLVFQDFHLVPELDVIGNILLPLSFGSRPLGAPGKDAARAMADRLGLTAPGRKAALLSRGEQQRVALARALFGNPALILADEPTASLDPDNAALIADVLICEARRLNATLLCVSHDPALLARMDRHIRLESGRMVSDTEQS